MNRRLKYFLISFILSSILMCLVFIVFPLIFASLFTGSFFPFGGFLGVTIFAGFIPGILIFSFLLFIAITVIVAEKGTKTISVLIVLGGFILPLILFLGFSQIQSSMKIADYSQSMDYTESLTDLAIKENNTQYCEDIYDHWKQKENDVRTKSSDYHRNLCFFWLAYSVGDYSNCDKIGGRDMKNKCLIIAALKNKDTSYCFKSKGYLSPDLEIAGCLEAASRAVNNVSICDEIREKYDVSGSEANRCYARFALFSEDTTICNQITRPDLKESCPVLVDHIGNFEQSCDKEYTCYNEFQCELEKQSQKLQCLALVKTFELDREGCLDIYKDEKYDTCEKINRIILFKENNPELCKSTPFCNECFTKQTDPSICDYDYFYYLDRFHEFRVGY